MSDAGSSDWEIDDNNKAKKPTDTLVVDKDKDSDEEELERLVLGDRAGFRSQLFSDSGEFLGAEQSMEELSLAVIDGQGRDSDDEEFEDADDAHMFLYDESMQPHTSLDAGKLSKKSGAKSSEPDPNAAAWEDSDDERLVVSLAGRTQFRKLRRTEAEDIVSGTEYTERVRQQYLRLSPHPAWAVEADKARLARIEQRNGGSSLAKKEKKRQKKARAEERRLRRESKAAKGSDDEDEDEDEDDEVSADSESEISSDSGSDSDSASDSEEFELLQSALPLDKFLRSTSAMAGASQLFAQGGAATKQRRLRPEVLDIQKSRDIPTKHKYAVTSLAFHPAHNVLLSSSISSVVHLHQIAPGAYPTPNPLLTSVQVRHAGVRCTEFLMDADALLETGSKDSHEIVFGGRRKYFHKWDMGTGKVQRVSQIHGHELEHKSMERFHLSPAGTHMAIVSTNRKRGGILNILDVNTMMWVAQARQESVGGVADFQWWRNGEGITILGRDGRVGEWCLETRRFVAMWRDSGSTGGTAIAMGGSGGPEALGGDRWLALGSKSGITNMYDRAALVKSSKVESSGAFTVEMDAVPTPLRVLEQLTTPVTTIVFTPDGQLMAFASQHQRDALRLVHLPSATVYRNWPTVKTPLGKVTAVAFSRNSEYLAVANDQGKTRLWEIRA